MRSTEFPKGLVEADEFKCWTKVSLVNELTQRSKTVAWSPRVSIAASDDSNDERLDVLDSELEPEEDDLEVKTARKKCYFAWFQVSWQSTYGVPCLSFVVAEEQGTLVPYERAVSLVVNDDEKHEIPVITVLPSIVNTGSSIANPGQDFRGVCREHGYPWVMHSNSQPVLLRVPCLRLDACNTSKAMKELMQMEEKPDYLRIWKGTLAYVLRVSLP